MVCSCQCCSSRICTASATVLSAFGMNSFHDKRSACPHSLHPLCALLLVPLQNQPGTWHQCNAEAAEQRGHQTACRMLMSPHISWSLLLCLQVDQIVSSPVYPELPGLQHNSRGSCLCGPLESAGAAVQCCAGQQPLQRDWVFPAAGLSVWHGVLVWPGVLGA